MSTSAATCCGLTPRSSPTPGAHILGRNSRNHPAGQRICFPVKQDGETAMKFALIVATVATLATPAFAEEVGVGVGVGPVGAGVTVGESHRDYDRDRDHTTTVIKEREPTDRTTVIKKEN